MSRYEKILLVCVAVLVVALIIVSLHEIREPGDEDGAREPNFAQSIGPDLKIGTFATVLDQQSSGPKEADCTRFQPIILAALHDIDMHLEQLKIYSPGVFEVNQRTLDLMCAQNASVTLRNDAGAKLLLEKVPFTRSVPAGGKPSEVGTLVRINATVIPPGVVPPTSPTTYGEELIPDSYLDADNN